MSTSTHRTALAFASRKAVFDLHRIETELHFIGPIHPKAGFFTGERDAQNAVLESLEEATAAAARKVLS